LRSGFVAGDAELLRAYFQYRTYQGCAMPLPTQQASILAWQDEHHVIENRRLYREKFAAVIDILSGVCDIHKPAASFYVWLKTSLSDTQFTQQLFDQENVTVLPGSYLSREFAGVNPGQNHVRIALVAPFSECIEAAHRIKNFLITLTLQ
jgi:N-succinyldiaminopimelate aminotransferase